MFIFWLFVSFVSFNVTGGGIAGQKKLTAKEDQEIRTILSAQMDKIRQHFDDSKGFKTLKKKYGVALVPYLEEYIANPHTDVRWRAYADMVGIGVDANDLPSRQAIVYKLLTGLRDDSELEIRQSLDTWLLRYNFRAADFSEKAKELLRQQLTRALVDPSMNPRGSIILLVGVADMKSELPRLVKFVARQELILKRRHEEYVRDEKRLLQEQLKRFPKKTRFLLKNLDKKTYWQSTEMWDALRAAARMGSKPAIRRCINLVESHPDERTRHIHLIHLAYVRQPDIVDYLHECLNHGQTDEEIDSKIKGDQIIMSEAQRAAMSLARMLRGFPVDEYCSAYPETIRRCRKWMAEQTEWDIIR